MSSIAAPAARAQTIAVQSAVAGETPRAIGLKSGSYLRGSNTTT